MKTTIDLPEALYRQAKIRAVERSTTLKDLIVSALAREVAAPSAEPATPGWTRRTLLPAYQELLDQGAFSGGTDSTRIISEERDAR